MFEQQISQTQDRLEAVFVEKLNHLQSAIDELSDRMALVEKDFATERDKYVTDLEQKNALVAKDVQFLQDTFAVEKMQRGEKDGELAKRWDSFFSGSSRTGRGGLGLFLQLESLSNL